MKRGEYAGDFERWLDRELPGAVASELRAAVPPRRPAYLPAPGSRPRRSFGLARLGVGGAAAAAVLLLAAVSGGAALATGSPNPVTWGQHMVRAVSGCADQSAGRCVRLPVAPPPPGPAATMRPETTTQPSQSDSGGDHGARGSGDDKGKSPVRGADTQSGNGHGSKTHSPAPSPPPGQAQGG